MTDIKSALLAKAEALDVLLDDEIEALGRVYAQHHLFDLFIETKLMLKINRALLEDREALVGALKDCSTVHACGKYADKALTASEKRMRELVTGD